MRITITSVMVDDQAKALAFYTDILGFEKKTDIPMGEYRWLTLVSPERPDGVELLLEPNAHAASIEFQKTIFKDGIPATMFEVDDVKAEYERLKKAGVEFKTEPTEADGMIFATFNDTCGNYIQIYQQ